MYPNLYYAFRDLFGVEWPALMFINSFGFFVALSFLLGAVVLAAELKRKSKLGLLHPTEVTIKVGEPASLSDLLLNFFLGFLLGYKIIALFILDDQITSDPQAFIFSTDGSWLAGIAMGGIFAGLNWWEKKKQVLAKSETRKIRIWPQDRVGEIAILALVFGLVGAKIFDTFENWSEFINNPSQFLSPSGLTFYGGLICATLVIWWYAKKHKIGFWHLNDAAAPALMIAYALGRVGCHISGDGDWGIDNLEPNPYSFLPDWIWSYNYPNNVNEMGIKIEGCADLRYCYQLANPVYPTAFYEVVICTILFLVIWVSRKKIKIPGVIFAFYLILNGLERFAIEKIRVNSEITAIGFQFTQAELISSLLVICGFVLMYFLKKSNKSV